MDYKTGFLVVALLAGCIAAPRNDFSKFFEQMGSGPRIIGGTQAAEGSHPHMVALSSGLLIRTFDCGASLVSRRTVLTAAHCVDIVYRGGELVRSLRGTVGATRWALGGTDYSFERNITHPGYLDFPLKHDIALLITTTEVVLNNLVQVVPIGYDFVPGGIQSRVAGWGRFGDSSFTSPTLRELTTTTISGDDCIAQVTQAAIELGYRVPAIEPDIEVCTYHSAGVGNCHGDSGSALTRVDNGQQIGVVSWGFPCALGAPDMFVRLSAFQSWFQSNIV